MQSNFRNPILIEPKMFGGQYSMNTPVGTVSSSQAPPLPPRLINVNNFNVAHNRLGYVYGNPDFGNSGLYDNTIGANGFISSMYDNTFGYNAMPYQEHRVIRILEEKSRPTFQSIESFVIAISNIATMLDSTFFALTSSFKALLAMTANFVHLRKVFSRLWTSFALLRWIRKIYTRLLLWLQLTKTNTSADIFEGAYNLSTNVQELTHGTNNGTSKSVVLFLCFIMAAPFLLLKLFSKSDVLRPKKSISNMNPELWKNPVEAIALFNFTASNKDELSIYSGQNLLIAPKSIQKEHNLLATGWVLASVDNTMCGLIPVNYVKSKRNEIAKDYNSDLVDGIKNVNYME